MPGMDFAFMVPVVFFISIAVVLILRGPVGQALGLRISGGGADSPVDRAALDDLRDEMEDLRDRLVAAEERIDFTERLLTARSGESSADE